MRRFTSPMSQSADVLRSLGLRFVTDLL